MPAVSVVIAAYNRAGTVTEAVHSVLRQTWTDLEVVVVDDGSVDGTPERVEAIDDPRVRLLRSPANEGVSAARNRGIAASDSRWVAFQDSDDEWLPHKLRRQLDRLAARAGDDVGAYCGMLVVDPPDEPGGPRTTTRYLPPPGAGTVEGDLLVPLLGTNLISTQTMVVRRDLIDRVGGFDDELAALVDWEWALRLSQHGTWAFCDEPLVLQRFSPNSLTHGVRRRADSAAHILHKHADLYQEHPALLARRLRTIAGSYRRVGDYARAQEYLARARPLAPRDPGVWLASAFTAAGATLAAAGSPSHSTRDGDR